MEPVFPLKPWHRPSAAHWDPLVFLRGDAPQLVTQLLEDEADHEWDEAHEALRSELGAALATFCAPMVPPAPPRFSITTGWPSRVVSSAPTRRPIRSVLPPGG